MDATFWHQRWAKNEIGFHEKAANPLLVRHFGSLSLPKGSRIFVPLCGKTLDIGWLLASGHCVAGAELSDIAVQQLFADLGMEPAISSVGDLKRYSAKNIDIFRGDILQVSSQILGPVDAIYDRAALVALPTPMRTQYAAHLITMANRAPQLLIAYEYDQTVMEGPPFSVRSEEVATHYAASYELTLLESVEVVGGLKGKCAARELVWLLRNE